MTRRCSDPVAAIIAAKDEADAIRIANDSEFGLGSGVLTGDLDRGRRIARDELEAGMSFVNENVRSDPADAVRRGQAFRLRPRMRRLWHPRVRQHQDGAGEAARRQPDRRRWNRGAGYGPFDRE